MKIGDYETSPLADCLPLMEGEAYESLVKDIRANGLVHPIWLYRGKILDGRNRLRACIEAGVEPRFEDKTDCDPSALEWSVNWERRNMTPSVRAMIIAKRASLGRGQRVPQTGTSAALTQSDAAKLAGVGERTIRDARAVLEHGDAETIAAVQSGELPVKEAAKRVRPEKQPPNKPRAADLASMLNAALREGLSDQVHEHDERDRRDARGL